MGLKLKPGPRKPIGRWPVTRSRCSSVLSELCFDLLFGVEVQPRLVVEAVIANLVPRRADGCESFVVLFSSGVLADDEDGHFLFAFGEELDDPRDNDVQVRRVLIPTGVAVGLHVRPFVVEVERQAGDWFCHGLDSK